jgi:hypothetical protein
MKQYSANERQQKIQEILSKIHGSDKEWHFLCFKRVTEGTLNEMEEKEINTRWNELSNIRTEYFKQLQSYQSKYEVQFTNRNKTSEIAFVTLNMFQEIDTFKNSWKPYEELDETMTLLGEVHKMLSHVQPVQIWNIKKSKLVA